MENHPHDFVPSTSLLTIVIPISIVVLVVGIILLVLILRRLQHGKSTVAANNTNCMFIANNITTCSSPEVKLNLNLKSQVQVFTLKELETATKNFAEVNLIAEGVYRGVSRKGNLVAIKMLHRQGRQGERGFRFQVDLLSRLRSAYIAQLVGYCADQHHRILVYEYMGNATLRAHLTMKLKLKLNWGMRLSIALDCARGLEYLHDHSSPSVIHRNLKSTNILLDHNYRAKICGFGLAKLGSHKLNGLVSTRVVGTSGYMAPEYASTGKLTTKSDVYSYGVILLELLTGRIPIDTGRPAGEHVLVSWALPQLTNRDKVVEMVDPALQGQYSNKSLIQVAAIAAMCVQTEADYRPLMTDVVQSLIPLVKTLSHSLRFNETPSPKFSYKT